MGDLFSTDPLHEGYTTVYRSLSELRELFHRQGRLDDSNAKLDEVAKLFAAYLAHKNGFVKTFPTPEAANVVKMLQSAFLATVKLPQYQLGNGRSIFGVNAVINLREGEEPVRGGTGQTRS